MKKQRIGIGAVVNRILIAVAMVAVLSGCTQSQRQNADEHRIDLFSDMQDVGRLELARMTVGKVGTITDPSFRNASGLMAKTEAFVDKLKVGDRIAVYSYDTYLRASIDMTSLTPDDINVDEENHTVELRLPPVKVEYDGRDISLREEHYRVSGLRTDITPAERARLKEQMNQEVRKELAADPELSKKLKATAERRAVSYFSSLLSDLGYEARVVVR